MVINVVKIEKMIAEKQLTKTGFSKICGISRQNVSAILNRGTCEPRTVGKIARGLRVKVEEIIGEPGTVGT